MRLASSDQIPFLEPHEDEDKLVRQHLASNNNTNDESLPVNIASPSKPNKRRRNQQQHENNRNVISYQDLDRPDEQRDATLDNRLVPKSNKTNQLPSDKTNNHYPTKAPPVGNDQALKLELDRIKKAGAQEREKLRAQRQAAAERERETHMKRNSAGDPDKREDGELGDSSDDENSKSTAPVEHKRSKKAVESESILDMSVMKLMRPMKLFHLDDEPNSSYRAYLTTHFGRVRVHCQKPQPNFFSNLSCIEETQTTPTLESTLVVVDVTSLSTHDRRERSRSVEWLDAACRDGGWRDRERRRVDVGCERQSDETEILARLIRR